MTPKQSSILNVDFLRLKLHRPVQSLARKYQQCLEIWFDRWPRVVSAVVKLIFNLNGIAKSISDANYCNRCLRSVVSQFVRISHSRTL